MKVSSLEAIGYLCEVLEPSLVDPATINQLLSQIVGALEGHRAPMLQLAALKALSNTLAFAEANMERDADRGMLVKVVLDALKAPHTGLDANSQLAMKAVAFECATKLASLYYKFLEDAFMADMFTCSLHAVQTLDESVGIQAIEFWSSLCEEELIIQEDEHELALEGRPVATSRSRQYIAKNVKVLIPLVTDHCLVKQSDVLEDTNSMASVAAGLLGLIALCSKDACVPMCIQFVQANVQATDWHRRDAAVVVYGSILDGPSKQVLAPLITGGIGLMVKYLNAQAETSVHVRDSSAWMVSMVLGLHHEVLSQEQMDGVFTAVLTGLMDEPPVAAKHCQAVKNFCLAVGQGLDAKVPTSLLSRYTEKSIKLLLQASMRPDGLESQLRAECFEALMGIIEAAPLDQKQRLGELLVEVLGRMKESLTMLEQVKIAGQRPEIEAMVMHCCATVQMLTLKFEADVLPMANNIMEQVLRVLRIPNCVAECEAIMCTGAMANALDLVRCLGLLIWFVFIFSLI